MKKSILKLSLSLVFLSASAVEANTQSKQQPLQKDYFFFQNDRSQVMVDWAGQQEASLNVIMQSLGAYFKKASENRDSVQDQILLAASAVESWFSGVAKSLRPDLKINTEIGFLPQSDAKYFRSSAEVALEQIKNALRVNKNYRNYSDSELTDIAVQKMPIGFDSKITNVQDFILSNPWPSSQIQVLAGDVVLDTVSDRLRVLMSIVLSLPAVTQNLQTNLGGYALLDRLVMPSSYDGRQPVYAILNLEMVTTPKDLKLSEEGDLQLPLSQANLKIEFATKVKVTSANRLNIQDNRGLSFVPVREGNDFESSALAENYSPTERLPYLRAANILPKGKIWKPLERILGPDAIFDFGFVNLYSVEVDLANLQARHLNGRLEFFNRQRLFDHNGNGGTARGACLTVQDKDHCISWTVKPGDYLDQFLIGLINKKLEKEKQVIRGKIREKLAEFTAIASGSYRALKTRGESGGSYSAFSENMTKELCQDGILDPSDEQCQTLKTEGK